MWRPGRGIRGQHQRFSPRGCAFGVGIIAGELGDQTPTWRDFLFELFGNGLRTFLLLTTMIVVDVPAAPSPASPLVTRAFSDGLAYIATKFAALER